MPKTLLLCFIHGFKVGRLTLSLSLRLLPPFLRAAKKSIHPTLATPASPFGGLFMPAQTSSSVAILNQNQGGDDTFGGFPEHLRALVSHALAPNVAVKVVTYPKFETRGDLHECVARLREW